MSKGAGKRSAGSPPEGFAPPRAPSVLGRAVTLDPTLPDPLAITAKVARPARSKAVAPELGPIGRPAGIAGPELGPGARPASGVDTLNTEPKTAWLVAIDWSKARDPGTMALTDRIEEAKSLMESAELVVAGVSKTRRERPDPATYIGSGKVEEIKDEITAHEVGIVMIDAELSAVQVRNLERLIGCQVIDRTELILEIFSQRAQSAAGKMQIELARLSHQGARLVRGWSHLDRQRGGFGQRGGPGEKQVELDRRIIDDRIKNLKARLKTLEKQRSTQKRSRDRRGAFKIAIAGYTNAGKSTLFNRLTQSDVYAANKLFATLDPTARNLYLGDDVSVVISDTVGFLRDLPHTLVESFKATLEEAAHADLIMHVVDAANPAHDSQIIAVERVLNEIGAGQVPQIVVYNKIDLRPEMCAGLQPASAVQTLFVSSQTGAGLVELREVLKQIASAPTIVKAPVSEFAVPLDHYWMGNPKDLDADDNL